MNSAPRRVPPVVIAALVNILLVVAALGLGASSILPGLNGKGFPPVPVAPSSSEDPPPLTPITDPDPQEPQPVQQIVQREMAPALQPVAFAPSAGEAPDTLH
jgi:hypothetical protein